MIKRSDVYFGVACIVVLLPFFVCRPLYEAFLWATMHHPFMMAFLKFGILSTAGECIGCRIRTGEYVPKGFGVVPRGITWGFLGMLITAAMTIFSTGVPAVLAMLDITPTEGTYADGKITLGDEDMTMVFTREMPQGIQIAEVNPAAAAEDFDGTWNIVYIGYNGTVVDAAAAGQQLPGLVVENSTMKFTGEGSLAQVFGTNALPLTYADGALSMSVALGETSYGLKLEMLQDGMLALTASMGETGAIMYFVKDAAEEEPAA